jgi:hypothetical protein
MPRGESKEAEKKTVDATAAATTRNKKTISLQNQMFSDVKSGFISLVYWPYSLLTFIL